MYSLKEKLNKDSEIMQIIRFGIVGIISTVTMYGSYLLLLKYARHNVAFTISYILAFIVNYLLTTSFTFKVKVSKKNGVGFIVSNIINYVLNAAFLNFFIWIGFDEKWAPIPMYAVCIPINFLLVRFVMKKK